MTNLNHLLGKTGTDVLTDYRGVIFAITYYMTDRAQLMLQPSGDAFAAPEGEWFDANRIQIDEEVEAVALTSMEHSVEDA